MSLPVAAVIVNYNARRHLEALLASLRGEDLAGVVVVDNGSLDGSRVAVEEAGATWLASGTNLGYGRAANLGARQPAASGAEFLLVCNPDLVVGAGAVRTLYETMQSCEQAAIVGPRIDNVDGTLYPSARRFPDLVDAAGHGALGMLAPRNRFTRRYRMLDWDHAGISAVDWVSGACFLARRRAWDQVGGFDPAFFMYMEDVDLCWRLGRAGWQILYQPAASVMHTQGVSADRRPYRMLAEHHRSMWRFALRTTSGPRRAALPLVGAGLAGRFAATALRRRLAGTNPGVSSGPLP